MRKLIPFFIIVIGLLLLTGCSNQNLVPKEEAKNIVDTYDITSFSVSIDTKEQNEALKASFTEKKDRSEAEYSHKKDEVHFHGDKALEKLTEILDKAAPNPDMEETELLKSVAEACEFTDFKQIKIEITFKGHDSKEITMSK